MGTVKLDSGWVAGRVSDVSESGEELTTSNFPSSETKGWMEAVVPGTTLTTLLKNGLIPDPFYGLENENVADIGEIGREHYTFWFCKSFVPPKSGYTRAWLQFRGINYSAELYLNGHKTSLGGGQFLRHKLDITSWLDTGKENYLAVLVHPPDHPGRIPPEGGQGGDHDIAKDVAAQYVEGWDWICAIPDRNTGIWDEVTLSYTGGVTIKDPHVVTTFYDNFSRSYLSANTELINSSSSDAACKVTIQVSLDVEDNWSSVEHVQSSELSVKAGSSVLHTFSPLFFYKPQLWWPNGMGKQPLYKVEIIVNMGESGEESDAWSHRVGFRHIESHVNSSTQSRMFKVNGKPVFIRGGNWIVSDGLLRLSAERYKTEIGLHADMNFNMIRIWAGALAERPEFYDACDERGLLVWQEFWITGDCNGRGVSGVPSDQNWPLDHELFMACARDTVKLLRNHVSLALWVGGNEQFPAEDINDALTSMLALNDTFKSTGDDGEMGRNSKDVCEYLDGTRLYIKGSLWEGFADSNGGWTDGPYGVQNPEDFFREDFYDYGFNPEIGSIGVPKAATIRATMPPEAWNFPEIVPYDAKYVSEVPNATWAYHKYIEYSSPDEKVPHQIAAYGKIKDLEDFCYKAQLVNYIQYRALLESWGSRMWEKYTGVLIWKTQNPWPGLRGGLYDCFHDQTGGFFGVQSALEPVHIQLNLATNVVEIVNTTDELLEDVTVDISIWELEGVKSYQTTLRQLSSPAFKRVKVTKLPVDTSSKSVFFVVLKLFKNSDVEVSRNFYWLHKPESDYSMLEGDFQARKVPVQVSATATQEQGLMKIVATVENLSNDKRWSSLMSEPLKESVSGVAFWMHFSVYSRNDGNAKDEERILPVTYSNNFFSLVPGEKMTVQISFKIKKDVTPKVLFQGWNVDEVDVPYLNQRARGSSSIRAV